MSSLYRTKGELRAELLKRLGFGGLGSAAGSFVPMADSLLEEAQDQVFLLLPDEKRVKVWDMTTSANQRWYDFPETCDPDRIISMSVLYNSTWLPIERGIDPDHDTVYDDYDTRPMRWDIRARPLTSGNNLQPNGGFNFPDTTTNGGLNVWVWPSASSAQVSGGVLEFLAFAQVYGDTVYQADTEYDISYTIGVTDLHSITFGGNDTDIYGDALPVTVGTHSTRIRTLSTSTEGFRMLGYTNGTMDNLSVTAVDSFNTKPQIELWPQIDAAYSWRIEGHMKLADFVADEDRCTVDDRLVLLYAIAVGKAHLNRPDASTAMDAFNLRMRRLRGQYHDGRRYIRGKQDDTVPLPKPKVV